MQSLLAADNLISDCKNTIPSYKPRKTNRSLFSTEIMKRAVQEVIENNKPVREVARNLSISTATLSRYVTDARKAGLTRTAVVYKKTHVTTQVFSLQEETALADYIIKCSKMFHGLSIKAIRKLAWEYACQNLKTHPDSWDNNSEAGVNWFYGLMKREQILSLRMPEATSLARATAFKRQNVNLFFDKYESIITRPNFKLEPHQIWNLDETGIKTVQKTT